jgi:CrcB protein
MIELNAWIGIAVGGALGALARTACLRAAAAFAAQTAPDTRRAYRQAILFANTAGCFAIGLLAGDGVHLPDWLFLLLAVGFCGSLTTFSTLCAQLVEALRMQDGLWTAIRTLGLNLTLGYAALYLGLGIGA